MAVEIHRVNWVVCPECGYRFYVGAEMILLEGIQCHCPNCHSEFDTKSNLEAVTKIYPGMW